MAFSITRPSFSNFYFRNLVGYLVAFAYSFLTTYLRSPDTALTNIGTTVISFSVAYCMIVLHNRLLLEKFLFQKKYPLYLLLSIGLFLTWSFILNSLYHRKDFIHELKFNSLSYIFNILIGAAIYLGYKYVAERKSLFQLTILKRDIELDQLKTQLNPHFLFNALNNIYSYTLHSNKFGNELIIKLSELMRFIIDSSKKKSILVDEEVKFIENYLTFEKERLGERCTINYSKSLNYGRREIAPLILFPFIENAFKYGANSIQKTTVEIQFADTSTQFRMFVANTIINRDTKSTKTGLPNASRMLELLYPNHHELMISTNDNMFTVELTLQYDEN